MENGLVIKKLADKFWVKVGSFTLVCSPKGKLKESGIYVGDRVKVDVNEQQITSVEDRKTLLIRPPLANIDQIIIVIAPLPKPDFNIVDKLILFALSYGIKPILCINKIDIADHKFINEVFSAYKDVLEIIKTSAKNGNVSELKNVLIGKISSFAGQSAVGKSALTKQILPDAKVEIGELSKIERGKHTTRHSELFEINNSTFLADTSGFTSLDERLLPISYFELPLYYPDFLKYLENCKYRSCSHTKEEHCAVKKAVKVGELDSARYNRYVVIYENLKKEWQKNHG